MLTALLKKRVVTYNIYIRRRVDVVLEKLVQHSHAFQPVTIVRPLSQMCQALDEMAGDSESDRCMETIFGFIEQSFSRFMQSPYPFFDEAVSLASQGERIDMFSSVLVTFARQWVYLKNKKSSLKSTDLTFVTEWFCRLLVRLAIVGENSYAIVKLSENMDKNSVERSERMSRLKDDILRWVPTFSEGNNTLETSLPGNR
jgi:hypothetical protein